MILFAGHTRFCHCPELRTILPLPRGMISKRAPPPRHAKVRVAPPTQLPRKSDMGLEVERFEGEVNEKFICPYCAKVLEKPVAGACGHNFCRVCITKALSKRRTDCPVCDKDLDKVEAIKEASTELVEQLEKLSIHCDHQQSGCTSVMPYGTLADHTATECAFRMMACTNKGCKVQVQMNELDSHLETCEYRIVECKVCKTCVPRNDMPAHQALKRCYEQLNKRRMVTSARRLSQELRVHREEMVRQRHLTEQAERRLVQDVSITSSQCTEHCGLRPSKVKITTTCNYCRK